MHLNNLESILCYGSLYRFPFWRITKVSAVSAGNSGSPAAGNDRRGSFPRERGEQWQDIQPLVEDLEFPP